MGGLTSLGLMTGGNRVTAAQCGPCFGGGAFQQADVAPWPDVRCQTGRWGYPNLSLPYLLCHADTSTGQAQTEASQGESAGDAVPSGQTPRPKIAKNKTTAKWNRKQLWMNHQRWDPYFTYHWMLEGILEIISLRYQKRKLRPRRSPRPKSHNPMLIGPLSNDFLAHSQKYIDLHKFAV